MSTEDTLITDLTKIITDNSLEDWKLSSSPAIKINQIKLLTDLTLYLSNREIKIWEKAFETGKGSK